MGIVVLPQCAYHKSEHARTCGGRCHGDDHYDMNYREEDHDLGARGATLCGATYVVARSYILRW